MSKLKAYVGTPAIAKKFQDILGLQESKPYITSLLQVVAKSTSLQKCTPESLVSAAITAATLKLSLEPTFGLAYLVPFKEQATFQIGYKGMKTLAIRSGVVKRMVQVPVYKSQVISINVVDGSEFDWSAEADGEVIGYFSKIELVSGYVTELFMKRSEVDAHAKRYSKTFVNPKTKAKSLWSTDFDKMALKTIAKLHINSGEVPMNVEMKIAIQADQSVVSEDLTDFDYVDNKVDTIEIANNNSEQAAKETAGKLDTTNHIQAIQDLKNKWIAGEYDEVAEALGVPMEDIDAESIDKLYNDNL